MINNQIELDIYRLQARVKALGNYDYSTDIQLRIMQQVHASIELVQLVAEIKALKQLLPGGKVT